MRIERVDAAAECDGLVPVRAPDAVAVRAEASSAGGCDGPGSVSDGTGHVVLGIGSGNGWRQWQAFAPGGDPRRIFYSGDALMLPQPQGWIVARPGASSSASSYVQANTFFPEGSFRASVMVERTWDSPIAQWRLVEDPLGGALLVHSWRNADGSGTCGGDARRIDAAGALRGAPAPIGCWSDGAAVSSRGAALALEPRGGERWVHWIRPDGTEAVPAARENAPVSGITELVPLLDGSILSKRGDYWARIYPYLAWYSEPLPFWLVRRDGWTFRNTRGNLGYAFFPKPGVATGATSAECSQTIDLLSPSGRLCGKVTLLDRGGGCITDYADQGWDGTIVEKNAREPCSWRWWPRALAGGD